MNGETLIVCSLRLASAALSAIALASASCFALSSAAALSTIALASAALASAALASAALLSISDFTSLRTTYVPFPTAGQNLPSPFTMIAVIKTDASGLLPAKVSNFS